MNGLVQTVAPAGEPITLAEAKAWLRFESTDEDVLISSLIEAARAHVENFTRRALVTQQFEVSYDAFPNCSRFQCASPALSRIIETRGFLGHCAPASGREIKLPRPPLQSVQSVKYYDTDGALQTLDAASYFVDTRSQPGRIVLNDDYDWPDVQIRPSAVIIAFTAGYGTPSDIPQGLRTAMRFMLSHWFTNRTPVETGLRAAAVEVPQTADTLLWQHRIAEAY